MRRILLFLLTLFTFISFPFKATMAQQNDTYKGTIIEESNVPNDLVNVLPPDTQAFTVKLNHNNDTVFAFSDPKMEELNIGDKIIILKTSGPFGDNIYFITDHIRTNSILALFAIFVFTVVIISRFAGLMSLIGMGYSFIVIFKFLLPLLYSGYNPILITLLSVVLIAPLSFVLSHGFNLKTMTALVATIFSLAITSLLALIFINSSHLTGFGSEEAYFLQIAQGAINIKGIFLAGIIIGTLGILDDATVTQTSIVAQLKATRHDLESIELFKKAMSVGHDHIASTVNTLILVYTGSSLPLLLLFLKSNKPFFEVLNTQIIAEEVVTMLVSSIGLIISIPISTLIAVYFVNSDDSGHAHSHGHSHHH